MGVYQNLSLTQLSQDSAANTSQVRILWTSQQTGESHNTNQRTASYWIAINGGAATEHSVEYTLPQNTTQTILDLTVTVQHDNDGNGMISVKTQMDTRISAGVVTLEKSLQLTQIPRASTIGAGRAYIESTLMISVNRKRSDYTHSLKYTFGGLSGYIDENGNPTDQEVKLSHTNCWFNVPYEFYSQIPDSPSGIGTLLCRTFLGDQQIGQDQPCELQVYTDENECGPLISYTQVNDVNEKTKTLTQDDTRLIKGCSDARCVMGVSLRCGATLDSATIGGVSVELDDHSCGYYTIEGVTAKVVPLYVKDSRGHVAKIDLPLEMIDYFDVSCIAEIKRTDPTSGNAQLSVHGSFFNGIFGATNNSLSLKYRVDSGEYVPIEVATKTDDYNSYSGTIVVSGLDYQKSFKIEVVAEDALSSATKTLPLARGIPVFDWGENDFNFNVPVTVQGAMSAKSIAAEGVVSAGQLLAGNFNGVYIANAYLSATDTLKVYTELATASGAGNERQSILVFSACNNTPVIGLININNGGGAAWTGTGNVSAIVSEGYITIQFPVVSWDQVILISGREFSIDQEELP